MKGNDRYERNDVRKIKRFYFKGSRHKLTQTVGIFAQWIIAMIQQNE